MRASPIQRAQGLITCACIVIAGAYLMRMFVFIWTYFAQP